MAEFKKWVSYLYAYGGEIKGNNVGFARVEVRDGRCRLDIKIKGAYGCDTGGLDVGLYIRRQGRPERISVGSMKIQEGCGEYEAATGAADLFGKRISWEEWGGLWLICPGKDTVYLASWEKTGLDAREFLGESHGRMAGRQESTGENENIRKVNKMEQTDGPPPCQTCPHAANMPGEPSLWDSMTRYYPKIWPQWQQRGIEMLQIRPADIRYLPRRLWYYGNNSFLLHGYYQYKHLMLGRMTEEDNCYLLGVPGRRDPRESYSAEMFGFHHFLPVQEQEGYWYTKIRL